MTAPNLDLPAPELRGTATSGTTVELVDARLGAIGDAPGFAEERAYLTALRAKLARKV